MSRLITSAVLVLLLAAGTFLLIEYGRAGWAQQVNPSVGAAPAADTPFNAPTPPARAAVVVQYPQRTGVASGGSMMMSGMGAEMGEMMGGDGMMGGEMMGDEMYGGGIVSTFEQFKRQLQQQAAALRQAKSAADKERATSAIQKLLGDYFDSDMKRRQQELEKVKQRVAKLETLLDKRQSAKQEIIDLQLKTTVNESEGLGFFSEPMPGGYGGGEYGGGYGGYPMGTGYGEDMHGSDAGYGSEMMGSEYTGGSGMSTFEKAPKEGAKN